MIGLFILLQWLLGHFARVDHTYGNVRWYFGVATRMHDKGFFNVWTPYPPVFPALLYLATSVLTTYSGFLLFWKCLNVTLVAGIAVCIYLMLRARDSHRALFAATGYVLINATWKSHLTIGFFFDQFEYFPIVLVMLSLYLLMRRRVYWSAVVVGIGAMAKLFPAVILLVALFSLKGKQKIRYAAVFALTCIAVVSPYLIGGTQPLRSWLAFSSGRGGWETVWTYPKIKFPPIPNPDLLAIPVTTEVRPYGWLVWLTAGLMLVYLWWQRHTESRMLLARKTLCLLLLLLIFSKGVSSYFIFWIFPLVFVCYPPIAAFALCVLFLLNANIEFFVDTFWISIWTRHALFVALLVHQAIRSGKDDIGTLPVKTAPAP